MFAELQRVRFLNNQADAVGHDGPLPPRKQAALDLVKVGASKVTTVILNDPRYPKVGASVLTLSGKSHVLSNIAQDYGFHTRCDLRVQRAVSAQVRVAMCTQCCSCGESGTDA